MTTSKKSMTCIVIAATSLSVLSGCAAESESPSLPGEAAPTVQGVVASSVESDGVEVVVFWSYYPSLVGDGAPGVLPGERVLIEGSFPSAFTLSALSPPPDFVLQGSVMRFDDPTASRVADGYIVAVRPGANYDDLQLIDMVGSERIHSIAYVETDIEAGSFGEYLVGPLQAGFHLIETTPLIRDCEGPDMTDWYEYADGHASCVARVFRPARLGFETQLQIQGLLPFTNDEGVTHQYPHLPLW